MNRALSEKYSAEYPDRCQALIDPESKGLSIQFNRHGTLLAVGCNDGRIVVYDFATKGEARSMQVHTHPVSSLSWSRNGHLILSSSTDNVVAVTDVETNTVLFRDRYSSPVIKVQFHPRNHKKAIAVPLKPGPILFIMEKLENTRHVVDTEEHFGLQHSGMAASFNRQGTRIFTGSAKGEIHITDTETLRRVASFRIRSGYTNTIIRQIEFARKGAKFLVNVSDKIIRVYDEKQILQVCDEEINPTPQPEQMTQDIVNRHVWRKVVFSGNGDFICSGSQKHYQLVIWERAQNRLVNMLEGNRGDFMLDLAWHPFEPIICSVATNGVVMIWTHDNEEKWSAFAPDFTVLEENVEYVEGEDEFDEEDEDKTDDEEERQAEDDVEIDVVTVEPIPGFLSSDEEEEDKDALTFIAVRPDWDETDEDARTEREDPTTIYASDILDVKIGDDVEYYGHPFLAKIPRKTL